MTALLIVLAAIVLLFIGYVFYGSWLAKQWGIDPTKKTPAIEKEDGVDYVAAKPAVLMGHHFSSIAGAGPINGPIQASIFGWVPVFLWCIIGGIFFGGLQDFGSLFASIRHDGKSVGEIIEDSMVIIPVYNASATLFHCLESLDRQTYRKLELLLVDDCSTDESLFGCRFLFPYRKKS